MNEEDKKGSMPRPDGSYPPTLAWDVDDVARELKCSVRHVFTLVSQGKIPYSKVGRLLRFSPAKVQEWLQKGGTR